MAKDFYTNRDLKWSEENTSAAIGAAATIAGSYFNSQATPGYQPPAPTYNVYQLPANTNPAYTPPLSNPVTNFSTAPKTQSNKIFGMSPEIAIIGGIIILAIAGFAYYYFKNKKI